MIVQYVSPKATNYSNYDPRVFYENKTKNKQTKPPDSQGKHGAC